MTREESGAGGGNTETSVASVEDAFSVLGDETRLRILLELAEVVRERGHGEGLPFAELRRRAGVDDSGRFNYHLSKLEDGFIEHTEGEYVARFPALSVVSAVYAGIYGGVDGATSQRMETDRECQLCDRPIQVRYEGHTLWMECEKHGMSDRYEVVPPGAYRNRSLRELEQVVFTRVLVNLFLARRGICLQCWGPTSIDYPVEQPPVEEIVDEQFDDSVEEFDELVEEFGEFDEFIGTDVHCERCWNQLRSPLRSVVAIHPVVLGAHRERGYGLLETVRNVTRIGEESVCETELHGTDPASATVRIDLDDETLVLDVDEECSVVDYRWE